MLKAKLIARPSRFPAFLVLLFAMGVMLAPALPVSAAPAAQAGWPAIQVTSFVTGFSQPVNIANAGDGSGRLFVVEKVGRIQIIKNGATLGTPFLDISSRVNSSNSEQGLLSVAFPPSYATRNHFYVYYINASGNIVVARYGLTANADVADSASEQIVITIAHPTNTNHNGGQMAFGVDGFLYIGVGDGGGAGDTPNNAQNKNILLGKVLRIDVESGATTYVVPASNPLVGVSGTKPEIWAYGLRNPWRFSFDRQTHDLYIGDVGQGAFEEVDVQPAGSSGGQNYGWHIMEGNSCYNASSCNSAGLTPPVITYDHSLGCSITGGFVYRGVQYSSLQGIYFYGDYCSGRLWGLRFNGSSWETTQLASPAINISTFGESETGELYVADLAGGVVYAITTAGPTATPTVTNTPTGTRTPTATPTITATPTRTATATSTPTRTATASATSSPTSTRTSTNTPTPTPILPGSNIAPLATVTVASVFNNDPTYAGNKAVDGIIGQNGTGEWAGAKTNPWIQLDWATPQTVNRIRLYDRVVLGISANGGTLTFSDGSSLAVSGIPDNGTLKEVTFAAKTITWVKFKITSGGGTGVGLSEIEVYTAGGATNTPSPTATKTATPTSTLASASSTPTRTPTPTLTGLASSTPTRTNTASPTSTATLIGTSSNVAPLATVTVASVFNNDPTYGGNKAVDGIIGQNGTGEWAGAKTNPWIQLDWATPQTVNRIRLYDRVVLGISANGGTLTFSDGSSLAVSGIPDNGTLKEVTFAAKTITWVKFKITSGTGTGVGLSEIEVYTAGGATNTPTSTNTPSPSATATATKTATPTSTLASASNTPTKTPTPTTTSVASSTLTRTNTASPTTTATATRTLTAAATATPTSTVTLTRTTTATITQTLVPTATPTRTLTATTAATATRTATVTLTPTATATITQTPLPTATRTATLIPTATRTPTVTLTQTPTRTPTLTATITLTPIITPTSSATAPTLGGCPMFPANNYWNTRVDSLPLDSHSTAYINSIGRNTGLHPDFGSGLWDGGKIGIPYNIVDSSVPKVNVTFDIDDQSDAGPYPIPSNVAIEGGDPTSGDRHILIVESGACKLYELWAAEKQPDGSWNAGSGAIWDLNSNALRTDTWTSADAAGLQILPGLVRYAEAAAGEIRHAIRFTADATRNSYIWPARHQASDITDLNVPPMGQRFRLKASVNISTYPPKVQAILRAMQLYGLVLADNGSNWYISGVPDEGWNNDELVSSFGGITGDDFEAVDTSSLMIDPNSGQAHQP